MRRSSRLAISGLVSGLVSGVALLAGGASAAPQPLRLAVTDISGLEMLQTEFGRFRDVLAQATGQPVAFYPVSSRTAAVEAMRAGRVDFVLTGPAEYVVFRTLAGARPVVGFSRPDYYSAIVTLADSGIYRIEQLKGRKVAFGAVGSTSDHLAPAQILADAGLDPLRDVVPAHIDRNVAWEALKRGDVAAVALGYRKLTIVREREKDLPPGAFRVIARGPDLPNDVLVAGSHVAPDRLALVRRTFVEHSSELVAAILAGEENQKYQGMKFVANVDDGDYEYVRSMYRSIGRPQLAEFVGE
jgi:phosphonate transport system substrate-binding protein